MVGNTAFALEYAKRYASIGTSYNIVNPEDPIPKFPLSYNETKNISENVKTFMFDHDFFKLKNFFSDGLIILLEDGISKSVNKFFNNVKEQIVKELGPITLPTYVHNFNYQRIEKIIEISPVTYPKMLKDSSIIKDEFYNRFFKKGDDGQFLRKSFYSKEPWSYQHKPYNYYTSKLSLYFPDEYLLLQKKYLLENCK